jgi:hypothetical protein
MLDVSYSEALAAADEPHAVLLGPVPCQDCGMAVEWAGLDWLNAGSRRRHLHLGAGPGAYLLNTTAAPWPPDRPRYQAHAQVRIDRRLELLGAAAACFAIGWALYMLATGQWS